jgi:hypothetical protein
MTIDPFTAVRSVAVLRATQPFRQHVEDIVDYVITTYDNKRLLRDLDALGRVHIPLPSEFENPRVCGDVIQRLEAHFKAPITGSGSGVVVDFAASVIVQTSHTARQKMKTEGRKNDRERKFKWPLDLRLFRVTSSTNNNSTAVYPSK